MPEIDVNVARLALYGIDRFVRPHLICPPETLADMIAESVDVTSLYRSIKVYWASKSQPDMDIKSRYVRRLIINCATDVKCKLRAYVDNHSDNALERARTRSWPYKMVWTKCRCSCSRRRGLCPATSGPQDARKENKNEHVCSDCPGSRPGGPCWYPDNWDEIEANHEVIDPERAKAEEAYEQEQECLACAADMQINEYSFTRGDKS